MKTDKLLEAIWELDKTQVDEVFQEILERKRELYPEWELVYLALPRENREERRRILSEAIRII